MSDTEIALVRKDRCLSPDCKSSDAFAIYASNTGYCFSCGYSCKLGGTEYDLEGNTQEVPQKTPDLGFSAIEPISKNLRKITYKDLNARGISKEIAQQFDYGVNNGRHICNYYDSDGKPVAQKFRTKDKKFSWIGKPKESTLFGQQLFKPHPKVKIVLTEGELDCLSVAQAQSKLYPVVSLPNGAQSAVRDIKKHIKYLSGFAELILMFDMDEPGRKAAREVTKLFPPKYAKIAELPLKDANEMLVAGRGNEIVNAIFSAEAYSPEELKSGQKLLGLLDEDETAESYPLPSFLPKLNECLSECRLGELTVITAGSGSGKTSFVKELQHHFLRNTEINQGIIHLEEKLENTLRGIVGIDLKRNLSKVKGWKQDGQVRKCWSEIATMEDHEGNPRLQILDTFGSMPTDDVYEMIRYMANVENCKFIYLDHITMLVSGMAGNIDERKALDNIMTTLASLSQELNVHIFCISHLNNNTQGKPFEEGARATVNNLRGSGSLKQLAFNIIALTRNQMADLEVERNTIQVDLLKCRETGDTGAVDQIFFNKQTGCMEVPSEVVFEPVDSKGF